MYAMHISAMYSTMARNLPEFDTALIRLRWSLLSNTYLYIERFSPARIDTVGRSDGPDDRPLFREDSRIEILSKERLVMFKSKTGSGL